MQKCQPQKAKIFSLSLSSNLKLSSVINRGMEILPIKPLEIESNAMFIPMSLNIIILLISVWGS